MSRKTLFLLLVFIAVLQNYLLTFDFRRNLIVVEAR